MTTTQASPALFELLCVYWVTHEKGLEIVIFIKKNSRLNFKALHILHEQIVFHRILVNGLFNRILVSALMEKYCAKTTDTDFKFKFKFKFKGLFSIK